MPSSIHGMAVAAFEPVISTRSAMEDPEFLGQRLSCFAKYAAAFTAIIALLRLVITLVVAQQRPDVTSLMWHLVATAVFGAVWLSTRRPRGVSLLHTLDVGGIAAAAAAFAVMAGHMSRYTRPSFALLFILGYGMTLRAVFVPSTVMRTLLVAAMLSIPFSAVVVHHAEHVPSDLAYMGLWWLISVAVCAAISSVVYGLRQDVHRATRLGQYVLEQKLGEGGIGIVYRARHAFLKRATAVKVLRPDHSDIVDIARFENEVQLTSRLRHPNTVHVYDYGRTPSGLFFYAMELIEGASLLDLVSLFGPQPPARVAHIVHQIAGSLAEAHDIGLIHRDVKPANILLGELGGEPDVAKLVDFGMVKQLRGGRSSVTQRNALMGTPLYMAPEAISDPGAVDQRADIYALGCVAYFLLTGSDVFEQDSVVAVCSDHLHVEPESPSKRLGRPVPSRLEDLVMACLAKDPEERPRNARDMQRELEQLMASEPWSRETAIAWWRTQGKQLLVERGRNRAARIESETVEEAHDLIAIGHSVQTI